MCTVFDVIDVNSRLTKFILKIITICVNDCFHVFEYLHHVNMHVDDSRFSECVCTCTFCGYCPSSCVDRVKLEYVIGRVLNNPCGYLSFQRTAATTW